MAQKYPDLFAGIYCISGCAYTPNLCNLNNLKVINLSSKDDYLYKAGYLNLHKILLKNKNYTSILMNEAIHSDFYFMLTKGKIFEELLSYKREKYPQKITYRTEQEYYNKAYWIQINGIKRGKNFTKFTAEIVNKNEINVKIVNDTGFFIMIPPQIDKSEFIVKINKNNEFKFKDYKKDYIYFAKKKLHYITDECIQEKKAFIKGSGLLRVYTNPVNIVISKDATINEKNVAKNFASPGTNGFDSTIYVNYPIITDDKFIDFSLEKNIIIISLNKENMYISDLQKHCIVNTFSNGFEYKKVFYEGKYCIMQIIENPYNKKFSVLIIETNSQDMLRKNLVTRKLVISGYSNGFNTILNNQALIYWNNNYYIIYEEGGKLNKLDYRKNKK